jgi:hypothetical protein
LDSQVVGAPHGLHEHMLHLQLARCHIQVHQ